MLLLLPEKKAQLGQLSQLHIANSGTSWLRSFLSFSNSLLLSVLSSIWKANHRYIFFFPLRRTNFSSFPICSKAYFFPPLFSFHRKQGRSGISAFCVAVKKEDRDLCDQRMFAVLCNWVSCILCIKVQNGLESKSCDSNKSGPFHLHNF